MGGVPTPELSSDALTFITERHLASLTTVLPGGGLHVVAVGFTWQAGVVRIITSDGSRKVRNVREGGQAAVCQVDGARWLTLIGPAVIRDDPASVRGAEQLYAMRYRPPRVNPRRVVLEFPVERMLGSSTMKPGT
jgi:PPOX class probable F420-dependent enzyme